MDFEIDLKGLSLTKKITILLSISVLAISLTQPAFYIDRNDFDAWANSVVLFFLGWTFVLGGSTESLIWWANPIYVFAVFLFMKNNRLSIVVSILALTIAICFSLLDKIVTSESGERSRITSLELGYKMWVLSFAILFLGSLVDTIIDFRRKSKNKRA